MLQKRVRSESPGRSTSTDRNAKQKVSIPSISSTELTLTKNAKQQEANGTTNEAIEFYIHLPNIEKARRNDPRPPRTAEQQRAEYHRLVKDLRRDI
jgi:hypothetical protein